MGARLVFSNPPPLPVLKEQLAKVGIRLSAEQEKFLEAHGTHKGISVDTSRVYCRTCNLRDGQ